MIFFPNIDTVGFIKNKLQKVIAGVVVFHCNTAWKVSKYGVFSGPNTGKYGSEKIPYLDTFHPV